MVILGLNTWFHDTSACLVVDGKLVVALEEERFSRDKHTRAFPETAVRRCLEHANLSVADIDHVAVSIRPTHRWAAKSAYALRAPHRAAPFVRHELVNGLMKQRRFRRWLDDTWSADSRAGARPPVHFVEHHRAHAAGSFLVSPYAEAAILSLDGSGEWASAWLGHGRGNRSTCLVESEFPHSLGSVYEAVTEFCGFRPNYDEGKTMGLAPLGDAARFIDDARRTVRVDSDGRLQVDLSFFEYQYWGHRRCASRFHETFGTPRPLNGEFESHHADVAAAFQQVLEECALAMAAILKTKTQARHLVVAGGVALNSVMNGRLLREAGFDDLYVMPAAGDGGTAIGAAYCVLHETLGAPRAPAEAFVHDDPFVGTAHDETAIEALLVRAKLDYARSEDIASDTAALLERGLIVGWFQGRMEIGPRSLGARSILANPAFPDMKDKINAEVKLREAYRPFAPSATVEAARDFFDIEVEAPFMLKVCQVRTDKRELLPAITHVDGSARLQTVRRETAPLYHALIADLGRRTGVPVVLNTSFNIQGEPVVEAPVDAIRCFFSTGLDALAIGPFVVMKKAAAQAATRPADPAANDAANEATNGTMNAPANPVDGRPIADDDGALSA